MKFRVLWDVQSELFFVHANARRASEGGSQGRVIPNAILRSRTSPLRSIYTSVSFRAVTISSSLDLRPQLTPVIGLIGILVEG